MKFEEGSRLKEIGESAFQNCTSLAKINPPEGLTSVGNYAFRDCRDLKNIQLPAGLERIGVRCFSGSGLEELVLPSSVREVSPCAFYECGQLKSV